MKIRLVLNDLVCSSTKTNVFVLPNGLRYGEPSWHTRFVRNDGQAAEYFDYAFGLSAEGGFSQASVGPA